LLLGIAAVIRGMSIKTTLLTLQHQIARRPLTVDEGRHFQQKKNKWKNAIFKFANGNSHASSLCRLFSKTIIKNYFKVSYLLAVFFLK
jgi:hypothetical protein